jgi:hypothetical protein
MQRLRIYTGTDGHSHFEGLTPEPLNDFGALVNGPANVEILDSPAFSDYHAAGRREMAIVMSGIHEYGTPEGLRRLFPGDIVVIDDLTGQGHTFRAIGVERAISMRFPLAAGAIAHTAA